MFNASQVRRFAALAFVALITVVSGALAASPAQAGTTPRDSFITQPQKKFSAFDIPPSPLPAGKPGDIIRWRPMGWSKSFTKPPKGTQGYKIMYLSTSATGERIAVTASLMVPRAYQPKQGIENRPIIGYGNEAMGLGDNCAQSSMLEYAHSGELALQEPMLKRGYAVVSTDYEGLGTPSVHTFGVSVSSGHAILDSVRAARNLTEAGLPKQGPVALYGYSQGGQGIGRGMEMQPDYAPDVKPTAVAFGGTPTDPAKFSRYGSGKFFSAVNFAASAGFDAAYPELRLKDMLNERGVIANAATYNACIESIFVVPFRMSSAYLKPGMDPLVDPRWIKRFKENAIGYEPPSPDVPVYYFHAIGDEAVPYSGATKMRRQYCKAGVNLKFQAIPIMEHVATGPVWMPIAAQWVADRLEGKPARGNFAPNCWPDSASLPEES
ncbi:MAG: hypothetical protein JHD16_08815 [Solirubrobacteraceae bacterium]|nr:hypothetical protein [Solirubrobacteraceae bacterium]